MVDLRAFSSCSVAELDLFVLDAPHLFARPGNPYVAPDGVDWPDNARRFAALARTAAAIGQGAIPTFVPQVVHAHDWQAALAPAFLHYGGRPRPGSVMTVHNLAYQGKFPKEMLSDIGLPPESFDDRWGRILRRDRFLEGRTAICRSHHHGVAHLCARDPGG